MSCSCAAAAPPGTLVPVLSDQDRDILAEAYGLAVSVVEADAAMAMSWQEAQDDLLAELGRDKGWTSELTVRYLGALRRALQRDPRSPQ